MPKPFRPLDYYEDSDPACCAWLRELVKAGALPKGDVDAAPVETVNTANLGRYRRCHYFAGIGGWAYALELAGWPASRSVWTGSCPCQPFSCAGKRRGEADERHVWPAFFRLIRECRPPTVFGEQVGGAAGCRWLAGVRADLEKEGYACGVADLPAACVGAPHIRQRLFWVANVVKGGRGGWASDTGAGSHGRAAVGGRGEGCSGGNAGRMGEPSRAGLEERAGERGNDGAERAPAERAGGQLDWLGNAASDGHAAADVSGSLGTGEISGWLRQPQGSNPWANFAVVACRDGKARRVEPGIFPLAHGIPARMVRLRGYGNAIVAQVAAVFVRAFMEAEDMLGTDWQALTEERLARLREEADA